MSTSKKTSTGKNQEIKPPLRDASFYIKILKDPFTAAELYAQPDDDDLCEPLVRALEDPDELIRRSAVRALVALNDLYAASSIFKVVTKGSIPARRAAVEVLGRIGSGNSLAAKYLIHALSDPDSSVRETSIDALKKLGIPFKQNPDSS